MSRRLAIEPIGPPYCPGSGAFPDIIEDLVLGGHSYICAACGAIVPSFDPAPNHHPRAQRPNELDLAAIHRDVEILRSRLMADGLSVENLSPRLVAAVWRAWVNKDSGADVAFDPSWQAFGVTTPQASSDWASRGGCGAICHSRPRNRHVPARATRYPEADITATDR